MKKIFYVLCFSACAMAACTVLPTEMPEPEAASNNTVTLYLTGEKPALANATRTYYDQTERAILWSASDEYMKITYTLDGAMVDKNGTEIVFPDGRRPFDLDIYSEFPSCPATVSPDGRTATFTFSGKVPTVEGSYRLHGMYPAAAMTRDNGFLYGNERPDEVLLYIADTQYPTETTFDPDADVMIAISKYAYESLSDGMTVPMVYDRLVTHGRITLTDLNVPYVRSVKIMAPEDKQMTGIFYMNILDKTQSISKSSFNYIRLDYAGKPSEDGGGEKAPALMQTPAKAVTRSALIDSLDVWFCTIPFELVEDEELVIEVVTHTETLRRTITARSEGIKFERNKLSELTVSMAEADHTSAILEVPASISVAGNGTPTEFTVKTNLDISCLEADSWFTISREDIEPAADGCPQYKFTVTAPRSHSTAPRTSTVTIEDSVFGFSRTIPLTQTADEGDVIIGNYVGSSAVVGGVRWYPVNCGFDATHPHGLLYQWGRKKGQSFNGTNGIGETVNETPACTTIIFDTQAEFKAMCVERYGADTDYRNTAPDDNTFYGSGGYDTASGRSWYVNSSNKYDHLTSWGDTTDDYIGNPCPEGWRVPTKADFEALIPDRCGLCTAEENTVVRKRINEYSADEGMEFTENGQTVFFGYGGAHYYNETEARDRGYRRGIGMYWTSTTKEDNVYTKYAFNTSPSIYADLCYTANGYSVRCVQSVESAE